jgi:hypothetical protein
MMRRRTLVATTALIAFAAAGSAALAQDYPDMVGVWKGHADGIVLGDPDHFMSAVESGKVPEEPRTAEFDITITIAKQEGRYIWGTISGGGNTEPWLGSIWNDGKGYRAVDSNGHVDGRIISATEIENCYTHTGQTIVVSCSILTRQ